MFKDGWVYISMNCFVHYNSPKKCFIYKISLPVCIKNFNVNVQFLQKVYNFKQKYVRIAKGGVVIYEK